MSPSDEMRPLSGALDVPARSSVSFTVETVAAQPCRTCKGAGWVVSHRWEPEKPQRLLPCPDCNEQQLSARRLDKLVGESGLAKCRDVGFEATGPRPGQEAAWDQCMTFARHPDGWIFLHGEPQVGKTHLAKCVGNARLDIGRPAFFRVVPWLLKELRSTFNRAGENDREREVAFDDRFDAIAQAPHVVILDDLGAEQQTQWAQETLYMLLNHRLEERLPTVITSNMVASKIHPRVWARIERSSLCQVIEVKDLTKPVGRRVVD